VTVVPPVVAAGGAPLVPAAGLLVEHPAKAATTATPAITAATQGTRLRQNAPEAATLVGRECRIRPPPHPARRLMHTEDYST
jgi:hypothetical protein